jgi:hypothetical protein
MVHYILEYENLKGLSYLCFEGEDKAAKKEVVEIFGAHKVHKGVFPDISIIEFGLALTAILGDMIIVFILNKRKT